MCTFFGDILWPKVQSNSDDSHTHVTAPSSAHELSQAHPTMSCIHLVNLNFDTGNELQKGRGRVSAWLNFSES